MSFSSMESLGFTHTPALVRAATPPIPAPPPSTGARLVRKGRHVAPTGEMVRDLWDTTSLEAPSLTDWEPERSGMERLAGRDFRWRTLLLLVLPLLAVVAGAYLWTRDSESDVEAARLQLQEGEASLASAVSALRAGSADGAETVGDGSAGAAQLQVAVEVAARGLFETAALLPEGDPGRAASGRAAELALEAVARLRDMTALRHALEPVLVLPDLESDPSLVDLATATAEFVAFRHDLEMVLEVISPAVAPDTVDSALSLAGDLDEFQQAYLESLGRDDPEGAADWLARLGTRLDEIRSLLAVEMEAEAAAVDRILGRVLEETAG